MQQGLREAAQAVVERWDTPLWKDVPATAVYIADLRAALSAAPQPPEAEPVQLPEPVAVMTDTTPRVPGWKTIFVPDAGTKLYTEQQVLAILAQHGIKTT